MTDQPLRALEETSAPDAFRLPTESRALVAYLTMKLSFEQRRTAELDELQSLTNRAGIDATRSALTVATWWLDRRPRRWRRSEVTVRRVRRVLVRLHLVHPPATGWLISRRDLAAALTELDLFDADRYVASVAEARTAPLEHYLDHGYRAGVAPGRGFDPATYLRVNGDVAEAGIDPLGHYLMLGWRERRAGVGPIAPR